jgi:uncharacterized FlgJ-related protein
METDNFKSSLFTKWNNAFGMKMPVQRQTTAYPGPFVSNFESNSDAIIGMFLNKKIESLPRWAAYKSVDDSAEDIRLWMRARKFHPGIDSLKEFVNELGRMEYFVGETPAEYLAKVVAMKNRK